MNREEAKDKFREADRLFNERQFSSALVMLKELDQHFPNQRHILYPMARCLAGLKRHSEATDLAERIARDFQYAPAQDLYKKLKEKGARMSTPAPGSDSSVTTPISRSGISTFPMPTPPAFNRVEEPAPAEPEPADASHEPAPEAETPPPVPAVHHSGPAWVSYVLWIVLVLMGFGVYAGVAATVGRPALECSMQLQENGANSVRGITAVSETPWQAIVYLWTAFVFHFYFISCFPAYWSLRFVDGLRYNDFGEDMKDIATYTLIGFLLAPVIVIGWVISLVLVRRHFGLTAGKLAGAAAMFCVFDAVLYAVDALLLSFGILPALGFT